MMNSKKDFYHLMLIGVVYRQEIILIVLFKANQSKTIIVIFQTESFMIFFHPYSKLILISNHFFRSLVKEKRKI